MALPLIINGRSEVLSDLAAASPLATAISGLGLKADRIAVEHNGTIVPRDRWAEIALQPGDRLEIVHFVGGGLG